MVKALVLIGRPYSGQPLSNRMQHLATHTIPEIVAPKDSVILLPLCPASLTHENPQGRKIIHGMRPVGRKQRSTNLKIFCGISCFKMHITVKPRLTVTSLLRPLFFAAGKNLACENIRFSSLFVAENVSRGGTSATQRQKFHTDDANQCLHNKSGSHGVPNINLSNFAFVLVDFCKVLC